MTVEPMFTAGRTIWTCDDCGQKFTWNSASSWYGSYRAMDDGRWHQIEVHCGCRRNFEPMPDLDVA